ncbi:DEAD/DEAH box helicase [Microbacterium hominis]|uniref:DEAD/DEAH box helicase n=1 Tax=Microbacterium hominis TaxID=162426 RepID=UPI00168AFDE6|nr:DEAD/DEAH box helicase [Microbacterium hominis]QOC26660.1 DEAD/DEAH box helicase [Microbacterium hominis]QOC30422.1 DEAD/DEAH box helicase [Microbacterium hominis]
MPKSKKPAGGRAQNFEPRYGAKTSYQDAKRRPGQSSAGKPGSKSPGHRGYRAAEATDAAPKQRWSAQERAGRDEARGIRSRAHGDRPARDDRPARSFDDRPRRDDRPARSFDDRGRNSSTSGGDRRERPGFGSRDEDRRSFDRPRRDDRPARSFDDRPRRDDRPARSFDDRPRRDDRPARSFDDRGRNSSTSGGDRRERPGFGSRDTDRRSFDRPRRDDRPARSFDDRPRRDDRPARSFDDRPRRDDRPARSFDDRGRNSSTSSAERRERPAFGPRDEDRRSFDRPRRDDRPARDDRPRRDDRPARATGGNRADWNADAKDAAARKAYEAHADVVHEKLQAQAVQAEEVADVSFAGLGLGENIVRALAELGAAAPFPIQAATIAPILAGKDVLARGRTGSGKTIAFGAPLVESVLRSQAGKRRAFGRSPRALILAPTRELALQIDRTIQPIARSVGLFTTQIYGGVPQARQVGALKKGVDIIIGTPGRIEDLQEQGKLDLSEIGVVVLDEADHMSELGFLEPMQRILRLVEPDAQKLLFSATLDREVAALVDEFLVDPAVYEVAGEDQDSGTIDHRVLVIDHRDKADILTSLVDRAGKTLVFARTRAYAEMLAEQFDDAGIHAVALHGDLNQGKRTRNLERLTSGRVSVLVATDVAARGIHVDDIDLVIQADAPDEYKTYLHRSGRTGRAGRSGTVVTLIPRQRRRRMTEMLDRAEIDAPFEDARPGDDVIEELSGRQAAHVDR